MCEHHFLGWYSDRRAFLLTYYALIFNLSDSFEASGANR